MSPAEHRVDAGASLADELFEAVAALGVFEDADNAVVDGSSAASRTTLPGRFRINGPDRTFVDVRPGRTVSVGRKPPAVQGQDTLDVPHPLVSRRHLRVWLHGGRLLADELGSRNGTSVRRCGATLTVDGTIELLVGDQVATSNGVVLFDVTALTSP